MSIRIQTCWSRSGFSLLVFAAAMGAVLETHAYKDAQAETRPQWLWRASPDGESRVKGKVDFQRDFHVDKVIVSARLRIVGESAALQVRLNDRLVASLDAYDPVCELDVTTAIRRGRNRLQVSARGIPGPSAFFAELRLTAGPSEIQTIVSDTRWTVVNNPDQPAAANAFGHVDERLIVPFSRRVHVSALDNYEQWRLSLGDDADSASFSLTPGFEITRVRTAAKDEDSWVSMAFDERGRVLIGKEKVGLLRLTLSEEGDKVMQSEMIESTLQECRGLLLVGETLYANANNSKGLYRMRYEGNTVGTPELVYASAGGVGHGRNDLVLGPDGMIYSIHGDAVNLPSDAIDHTSPFREARHGKASREGHLLRIDPKTDAVELLASGLRNPYGVDFNRFGDAFTYDADAEFDMGAPWYRPTRVSHLVPGGDFGWRGVTGSWPPYDLDHPDNAIPNLHIGKGSPTSVKFGYRSRFPRRFQEALYVLDWAYGRILAVHVVPCGASYRLSGETFLQGRPLNVTDLDFGPDGAMYFVTGGRGTQSALYRVRYTGDSNAGIQPDRASTVQQRARQDFAAKSRRRRREMETALVSLESDQKAADMSGDAQLPSIWKALRDSDPWIRHAARNLLERIPQDAWSSRCWGEENPTIAVEAMLAMARSGEPSLAPRILERLQTLPWPMPSNRQSHAMLYAYELALGAENTPPLLLEKVRTRLENCFPSNDFEMDRRLSRMLLRMRSERAFAEAVGRLEQATRQSEQMHYLHVLSEAPAAWTIAQRTVFIDALRDTHRYESGAGMPDFLKRIRDAWLSRLSKEHRETLADALSQLEDSSSEPKQIPPRDFVKKWDVNELIALLDDHSLKGRDLRRGERLFREAACAKCHRFRGRGDVLGPDLTSVARRFGPRDLLQSIVEPSKVVAEKYRSIQITTSGGRSYVGRPAPGGDYRSPVLRLQTDPLDGSKQVEITKSEIEEQRLSTVSWMPEGLMNTLTVEEILDLLAYLQSEQRATPE